MSGSFRQPTADRLGQQSSEVSKIVDWRFESSDATASLPPSRHPAGPVHIPASLMLPRGPGSEGPLLAGGIVRSPPPAPQQPQYRRMEDGKPEPPRPLCDSNSDQSNTPPGDSGDVAASAGSPAFVRGPPAAIGEVAATGAAFPAMPAAGGTQLIVNHFPATFSDEDLLSAFSIFGTVTNVEVKRHGASESSKQLGFVYYARPEDAATAIVQTRGLPLVPGGRPISIEYCRSPKYFVPPADIRERPQAAINAYRDFASAQYGQLGGSAHSSPGPNTSRRRGRDGTGRHHQPVRSSWTVLRDSSSPQPPPVPPSGGGR